MLALAETPRLRETSSEAGFGGGAVVQQKHLRAPRDFVVNANKNVCHRWVNGGRQSSISQEQLLVTLGDARWCFFFFSGPWNSDSSNLDNMAVVLATERCWARDVLW